MKIIQSVLIPILVTVLILSSGAAIEIRNDSEPAAEYPQTPEIAELPAVSPDSDIPTAENAERFAYLTELNDDFAAWINIEDTGICYPVMYTPDDPDYYLKRDFYKADSKNGTPYIGKGCSLQSDNMIIYGHNMKNGTMFSDLVLYENEDFYKSHPVISFDTVEESSIYDIVAVFREKVHYQDEVGVFRYYDYVGDLSKEEFDEYIASVKKISLYDTEKTAEYGQQLLTLSTCAYHVENGRFAVVAVKR